MTDPERDNVQRSLGRVEEGLRRLTDQVEAQRKEANEGRSRIHERIDLIHSDLKSDLSKHDTRITHLEHVETGRKKVVTMLIGAVSLASSAIGAVVGYLMDGFKGP